MMMIFLFLFLVLCLVFVFEKYGNVIMNTLKHIIIHIPKHIAQKIWALLPRNAGVVRLCFIVGLVLIGMSFIKLDSDSGFGSLICGRWNCYLFGEPDFITLITAFCTPFVIAIIIKFILDGFKESKTNKKGKK